MSGLTVRWCSEQESDNFIYQGRRDDDGDIVIGISQSPAGFKVGEMKKRLDEVGRCNGKIDAFGLVVI